MEITRREFSLAIGGLLAGGPLVLTSRRVCSAPTASTQTLRFVVLADTHWGGYDDWKPERKKNTIRAVQWACSQRKKDFVVLNGGG